MKDRNQYGPVQMLKEIREQEDSRYWRVCLYANVQKVPDVRVRRCACVYGEKYLLLVRGVSRSKTLIPLILSQSGWIVFYYKNNEQSKYIQIQIQVVYVIF